MCVSLELSKKFVMFLCIEPKLEKQIFRTEVNFGVAPCISHVVDFPCSNAVENTFFIRFFFFFFRYVSYQVYIYILHM